MIMFKGGNGELGPSNKIQELLRASDLRVGEFLTKATKKTIDASELVKNIPTVDSSSEKISLMRSAIGILRSLFNDRAVHVSLQRELIEQLRGLKADTETVSDLQEYVNGCEKENDETLNQIANLEQQLEKEKGESQ